MSVIKLYTADDAIDVFKILRNHGYKCNIREERQPDGPYFKYIYHIKYEEVDHTSGHQGEAASD